jgi:FdhD protein
VAALIAIEPPGAFYPPGGRSGTISGMSSKLDTHPEEIAPSHEYRVVKIAPGQASPALRTLANETAVAIEFDGQPYAVMMLSPADYEDFAVGFALSERIVDKASDIARIDVRHGTRGTAIDIRLEKEHSQRLIERRRAIPGASGCGICGLTTIEEALPKLPPLTAAPRIEPKALFAALSALPAYQGLNKETGAVHAAAFCRLDGTILTLREDVGRHNAFDKVIGHLSRNRIDPASGFALLTSRCSFELAQKAVIARIPVLVTISAPTELAVTIARETKLTLVALARADSVLLFNDPFDSLTNGLN